MVTLTIPAPYVWKITIFQTVNSATIGISFFAIAVIGHMTISVEYETPQRLRNVLLNFKS